MKKVLPILLIFLSCTSSDRKTATTDQQPEVHVDRSLENVVIFYDHRTSVDLQKDLYTVHFMDSSRVDYKLNFTPAERNVIMQSFEDLKLNRLRDSIFFEDQCQIVPKRHTTIRFVYRGDDYTTITLDKNCKLSAGKHEDEVRKIQKFLGLFDSIITTKPQIKNAVSSDFRYM
jgi:hypothetical protein